MAIKLDWIPFGGGNSSEQTIERSDVGTITTLTSSANTYTDNTVNPNSLYDYTVINHCVVGGFATSNVVTGVYYECPYIEVLEFDTDLKVNVDPLIYGYSYSLDLYDITNTNLEFSGDLFSPTNGSLNFRFSGLTPETYYTVRLTIIPQDSGGGPDQSGNYFHQCTALAFIGSPPACPTASNVIASPQY